MYYCGDKVEAQLQLTEIRNKLVEENPNNQSNFYINYIDNVFNTIHKNKENIKKLI